MKKLPKNALMKAFKDVAAHGRSSESRPALRCLYLDEKGNAVVTDSHLGFKVASYRDPECTPVAFDLTSGEFYDGNYPNALPLFDTFNHNSVATVAADALNDILDGLKIMKESNVHLKSDPNNSVLVSCESKHFNSSFSCVSIDPSFTDQDFNAARLYTALSIMTSVQADYITIFQYKPLSPMILVAGNYSVVVAPVRVY